MCSKEGPIQWKATLGNQSIPGWGSHSSKHKQWVSGPRAPLHLWCCGGVGEIMREAGTFKDFYYSLERHPGLLAKSLLLPADKKKGQVKPKSSWNSPEKYNPLLLEFPMQKSSVIPPGMGKGREETKIVMEACRELNLILCLSTSLQAYQGLSQPFSLRLVCILLTEMYPSFHPPLAVCCESRAVWETGPLPASSPENFFVATPKHRNHCDLSVICLVPQGIWSSFQQKRIINISKQTKEHTILIKIVLKKELKIEISKNVN